MEPVKYKLLLAQNPYWCRECKKYFSNLMAFSKHFKKECSVVSKEEYAEKYKTHNWVQCYQCNDIERHEKMSVRMKGPENPWFVDGSCKNGGRKYGNSFSNDLRSQIKTRDNHKCVLCGLNEVDQKLLQYIEGTTIFTGLSIHHVDYDKTNNVEQNLISLCSSCHSKTTTSQDREAWTNVLLLVNKSYTDGIQSKDSCKNGVCEI